MTVAGHLVSPSTRSSSTADATVRVLRWTFRRDDDTVWCELGLTNDDAAYQLQVLPPCNPLGATVELFDDAVSALQRHATIERILTEDGWSLESFESDQVCR